MKNSSSSFLSSSPLEKMQELLTEDLQLTNILIIQSLESQVPLIGQIAKHLIQAGGKRLRPMLTLLASKMAGYSCGSRHIALAACVEFIHTATLMHDDVVDQSLKRRGLDTANALWGNKSSVLVGDFLFSRAFELMVEDGSLEVLKTLSYAASRIAEGEVLQLESIQNIETSQETYFEIIHAKTAELFKAAIKIGAIIANGSDQVKEALSLYGINLGIIFQLTDDLLDYDNEAYNRGKSIGDDFREGKVTLPVILSYQNSSFEEKKFWRRTLESHDQNSQDFLKAMELIKNHECKKRILDHAQILASEAFNAISIFPKSPYKDILENLLDFCINRRV
jgi:octaprenyl-diphosphate synthase